MWAGIETSKLQVQVRVVVLGGVSYIIDVPFLAFAAAIREPFR